MSELEDLLSIREQKAALRAKITRLERQISADEYALSDAALISGLMALPVYEQAGTIMLFSSFGYEPAMSGLMEDCRRRGKRVFLPRMLPGNRLECCEISESEMLVPGKYGILEPSRQRSALLWFRQYAMTAWDIGLDVGQGIMTGCWQYIPVKQSVCAGNDFSRIRSRRKFMMPG